MRVVLALILLALVSSANAKDLTITLNDDELKALLSLMDAGVKAVGINSVPIAARVIGKLQDANKVQPKPEEKK